jgi:uncharacterized membrane protein
MVSSSGKPSSLVIVAEPNCSASWRTNKLLLLFLAGVSLPVAIGFTLVGAWPILPLAGLELACLGGALYYVNWKLHFRHVIRVTDDTVQIEKGHYRPRHSFRFARHQARLAVTPENHPWDGPRLRVHDASDSVSVGEFLNRDDSLKLLSLLRQSLPVGTHSSAGQRRF